MWVKGKRDGVTQMVWRYEREDNPLFRRGGPLLPGQFWGLTSLTDNNHIPYLPFDEVTHEEEHSHPCG